MPYCTQQDLVDRFGNDELVELTDRQQLGEIDAAVVTASIADATADIDMYLSVRYALPLATVPTVLTRLCCDIARFYLHDNAAPERVEKANAAAIELLQAIAEGKIDLQTGSTSGAGDVLYQADAAAFDETQDWP